MFDLKKSSLQTKVAIIAHIAQKCPIFAINTAQNLMQKNLIQNLILCHKFIAKSNFKLRFISVEFFYALAKSSDFAAMFSSGD